jgi:hypothetical protein
MTYWLLIVLTYRAVWQTFENDYTEDFFEERVKATRLVNVIGTICIFCKCSYFLSLVDSIAPLIDVIVQIFIDIKWFMLVLFLYIIMLANCFRVISKNQINFDHLTEEEVEGIKYRTWRSSVWFVANMVIGNTDQSAFHHGHYASQDSILQAIFSVSAFIIIIHFLNLIIAIMGNTFGERTALGP